MSGAKFDLTIPVFERSKKIHVLNLQATGTGYKFLLNASNYAFIRLICYIHL